MSPSLEYPSVPGSIPNDDDMVSVNVPLLVGLLSAVGTLLLALLCAAIWFAVARDGAGAIRLPGGNDAAGSYDDEQRFLEEEAEALEHMDEFSRYQYLQAKAWIDSHPPNSANTDISLSQFMTIQEKGVSAWEFEPDFSSANCFVESRTEIEFFDAVCCVQTNLPIPKQNDVYYWEAKIYDKPLDTVVAIGLGTKPYPSFRLPGYHRYSVAYDSMGNKRLNQPFSAPHYGPPLQQGDVIGVGYRTRTGTIFFTRNGKKLDDAVHGMRLNVFPTIGATGPATIQVNFGQAGFVYIEANVKKWGLAPAQGSLAPPPPYGAEGEFVLLEAGNRQEGTMIGHSMIGHSRSDGQPSHAHPSAASSCSSFDDQGDSINLAQLNTSSNTRSSNNAQNTGPSHPSSGTVHMDRSGKVAFIKGSPPPSYSSETESISDIDPSEHNDEIDSADYNDQSDQVNNDHTENEEGQYSDNETLQLNESESTPVP